MAERMQRKDVPLDETPQLCVRGVVALLENMSLRTSGADDGDIIEAAKMLEVDGYPNVLVCNMDGCDTACEVSVDNDVVRATDFSSQPEECAANYPSSSLAKTLENERAMLCVGRIIRHAREQ